MKILITFLLISALTIVSFGQNLKSFEWGPKVDYTIFPGVRIMPESGPDIMCSRIAGSFFYGLSFQHNSKNGKSSSEYDFLFGKEPNLSTLTIDWDLLSSIINNRNSGTKSLLRYNDKQPILYLNYSYKRYLKQTKNNAYIHCGVQLTAPVGIHDENTYYAEIINDTVLYGDDLIVNQQNHNQPLKLYLGCSIGFGYRYNTRLITMDYKLKMNVFQPYYYGVYESDPDMTFYAKGSYFQKNYSIELSLAFYFKSFKNNK